tara:strand:- start:925 stop:1878 length:954 start_codon:yes stop_codon:yes gene_type:complete
MTIQYKELIESRTISRDADSFTASRTFLVYDDDDTQSLTASQAVNFSEGVAFSMSHPEIISIFADSFSISPLSERAFTYSLVWNYSKPEDPTDAGGDDDQHDDEDDNTSTDPTDEGGELDPPTGGEELQDSGTVQGDDGVSEDEPSADDAETERTFTGYSLTTGLALVDGYVAGATIPANGSQGGASGSLISTGTIVHVGGAPVTVPVPTTEISISESVSGSYFYLNDVQLKAGKRNINPFLGFDAGSVIFKGMSVQRQAVDQWDVSYTFAWDAWSHMRQVPKRDSEGNIEYEADGTTLKIFFKQPFEDYTSFSFAP